MFSCTFTYPQIASWSSFLIWAILTTSSCLVALSSKKPPNQRRRQQWNRFWGVVLLKAKHISAIAQNFMYNCFFFCYRRLYRAHLMCSISNMRLNKLVLYVLELPIIQRYDPIMMIQISYTSGENSQQSHINKIEGVRLLLINYYTNLNVNTVKHKQMLDYLGPNFETSPE